MHAEPGSICRPRHRRVRLTRSLRVLVAPFILGILGNAAPIAHATNPVASYAYDADGRLASVENASGQIATYNYDKVGNVLSIVSSTAAVLAPERDASGFIARAAHTPRVTGLSRRRVRVGGRLVISGSGFSGDRTADIVRVGPLLATVTSATSHRLVVAAPPDDGGAVTVVTPQGKAVFRALTVVGSQPTPWYADGKVTHPLRAGRGITALSGRVETASGNPLKGVSLSVTAAWGRRSVSTVTDRTGRFLLTDLSSGTQTLTIDARRLAPGAGFGIYGEPVQLREGRTSVLPWITYLTRIDNSRVVRLPGAPSTHRLVLTSPSLPGVQVIIPRGTTIRDRNGHVVRSLSITPLPTHRTPFPWGSTMAPPYFTIQPGDATVSGRGLEVIYPNAGHRPAGSAVPYLAENPHWPGLGWYRYGTGHVSRNGRFIIPSPKTRYYTTDPGGYGTTGAPGQGPPPGGNCKCGDPVDLSTGLLVEQSTDLAVPDTEGATLGRVFRQLDYTLRDFGIGESDSFNLYLSPDGSGNEDLILPDGGRIVYTPTTTSGVYDAINTPTNYAGSVLTAGGGDVYGPYNLSLRNGTQLYFGDPAYLLSVTDRFGNTVTINRPNGSQMESVTTPNGRWLKFTWGTCVPASGAQCITQAADNSGRKVSYGYDSSGRLIKVTNVNGGVTTNTWAPCNDPITCTELTAISDPAGRVTAMTYNASGQVTQQTAPNQGIWKYSYVVDGSGAITSTSVTDPRGHVSSTAVGRSGYSTSNTVGYGTSLAETTTSTYYPGTGLLESTTDPLGHETTYTYDALGNPLTVTTLAGTAGAATTTYTYEPKYNRIASVTDPLGHKTVYTYDDIANTETITDPLHRLTVITYNHHGQTVSVADPTDATTYYSYRMGDLVATGNPLGEVTSTYYDAVGRPLNVTDPAGHTTSYTYDAAGDKRTSTDPYGNTTALTYRDGELTSLTDANGNKTSYTRDALGDVTSETDALGKKQTWTYDLDGNLTSTTDRNGNVTTYSYDGLGRLITTKFGVSGSTAVESDTTSYNHGNRPIQVVDSATGTYKYGYDARGDVSSVTSPQGALTYAYNAISQRTGMTVPGQSPTAYTYDADGELTKLSQGTAIATYVYDKDGRVTSTTFPNGVIQTNSYNAGSELTGSTVVGAGLSSLGSVAYTYDPLGRVATSDGSLATIAMPAAISSATYNADNELTNLGTAALTYDNNGNLISDGTNTYAWNALNQLATVTTPTSAYQYSYDPEGNQIAATSGTTTTNNLYDAGTLVQQSSGAAVTANYLATGNGGTFQVQNSAGTFSPLTNQVGSTTNLTSSSGTIATTYTYTPGGQSTTTGAPNPDPQQFATGQTDGSGLVKLGARYYDPALGRFISQDPLGFVAGSANLYEYAGDNPVSRNDPSGLCGFFSCVWEGGVDFVAGAANGLTGGIFNIQPPYCGPGLDWAYGIGNVAGFVGGLFVGGEALDAVGASLRVAEAADAGLDAVSASADAVSITERAGTEVVNRSMSQAELDATAKTGLIRGGRDGTHFVTNDSYETAQEAQSALALPNTPEVEVQLEVPKGAFSDPSTVQPAYGFPGGGTERIGTGPIPVRVVGVRPY